MCMKLTPGDNVINIFEGVTYDQSKISYTNQWVLASLLNFQNVVAYFATAVSYISNCVWNSHPGPVS